MEDSNWSSLCTTVYVGNDVLQLLQQLLCSQPQVNDSDGVSQRQGMSISEMERVLCQSDWSLNVPNKIE